MDPLAGNGTGWGNPRRRHPPEDASGQYMLGRIHYLSFYNRASVVATYGGADAEGLPGIAPYWTAEERYLHDARRAEATSRTLKEMGAKSTADLPQEKVRSFYQEASKLTQELIKKEWKPAQLKPGVASEHATLALKAFDKAIKLDPENALYLLGRASLLEQAKAFYSKEPPKRRDPILSKVTDDQVADAYFTAYDAGVKKALELKHRPVAGLRSIASYEAGKAFERLCEKRKLSSQDEKHLADVKKIIGRLDKLRRGAITPIVFNLNNNAHFGELVNPARRAVFDLDGDGIAEEWPWVRGSSVFLVWDPARSGRILSGRQLFGSYTWQMPWENGYQPLAMLDQDNDGQLSNNELDGIRAWFDRDGDAISDAGEVVDLSTLDISSITTTGTLDADSGLLANREGIHLTTGKTLPTWDWLPIQSAQQPSH